MADVITRFKLETTQFDSKLRDAAKGLKEVAHQAELGGKDFVAFSQKQTEAARALGQTTSGANNAKDKVKDLVGAFNDAAKAYNSLSQAQQQSDFGKNLSASLAQLKERITEAKQELYGLGDAAKSAGGLFGGGDMMKGMLQVAGGNLITMGAQWAASLVGDVKECVVQSAELARQAEGVTIAFNRLGRGDILDGLREATHGTVSDLELMKAAVKFNDFKLPVEELGTMLAFAQQKAKDTGQSIDYMVDSIVTGLGRKSLMILDNLGLSAAEIRDKMQETGDMTKAVGEIIREQMSKAGDYVETAADRASKATVELNNAMLELGNSMYDVFGFSGWDELATKIKTEVVGALQFTVETINEAKNAWNSFMQTIGVKDKPKKETPRPERMPDGTYWETTDAQGNVTASGRWLNGKRIQTGAGDVVVTGHTPGTTTKTTPRTTRKVNTFDASVVAFNGGVGEKWTPQEMPSVWSMLGDQGLRDMMGIGKQQDDLGKLLKEYLGDPDKHKRKNQGDDVTGLETFSKQFSQITGAVDGIFSGIEALGVELPEGLKSILGGIQTVAGILTAISSLVTIITAIQGTKAVPIIGTFLAQGGVVKAASGTVVGNTYSNDQIPTMLNAGEVVLNQAQAGALASALQGGGLSGLQLEAVVRGEQLKFVLNTNGRRTGKGEFVTSNFR